MGLVTPPPSGFVCGLGALACTKNYKRHAASCTHCSPDRLRQIVAAERADKENRLTATADTESSQSAVTPDARAAVTS